MSDRREPLPGNEELDLGEDEEAEIPEDDEGDGEDAGADDEGEGDAGDDEGEEGQARHVERPRSRGESRAQRQANENRELRRRLEELERRGTEQRPQGPDPQAAAREEQEFYQSLELMAPAQAIMAVRDRERRLMGSVLQQTEARLLDRQDRSDFARLCETDRSARRLAPVVEQMIADARRSGNFSLDRETAFTFAYGKELRERGRTETPRQRAAAGRRVQRQTVRPGAGRGDAPRAASRRSQDSDDEAFLRGITLDDL